MKRIFLFSLILLLAASFAGSQTVKKAVSTPTPAVKQAKVEVYYFHFTRRCVTCQAVETESQKAVSALYPAQSKHGVITFKSLNLDDKTSKAMATRCKAEGQALLVISGNKRFDLTDQGFMYARNNPDKLKAELKKIIDPLIR
ncbi:MAG: nitrophenyl compound nitroreductase subunit ArsF family protein [Bacteroidota bacterium]|nr:nitrophenyl compound nitroreductase subunit ArsF family protein [Bacteroidota bacterium]